MTTKDTKDINRVEELNPTPPSFQFLPHLMRRSLRVRKLQRFFFLPHHDAYIGFAPPCISMMSEYIGFLLVFRYLKWEIAFENIVFIVQKLFNIWLASVDSNIYFSADLLLSLVLHVFWLGYNTCLNSIEDAKFSNPFMKCLLSWCCRLIHISLN